MKKLSINKKSTLLPLSSIQTRQRSRTPTPSTSGLKYSESANLTSKRVKRMRKKKRNSKKHNRNYSQENTKKLSSPVPPVGHREAEKTRNKLRNKTRNKQRKSDITKSKKKTKRSKKYQLESGRSRSQTVHGTVNSDVEFPDIMKFDKMNKNNLGLFQSGKPNKKGWRKYHNQSHSTGHTENMEYMNDPKPVVIRVCSEDDQIEQVKRGHTKKGLNMSKTDQDDDMFFAEVHAEIEQRQSGLQEIEKQLNELQNTDFDSEFEKSLEQGKVTQNQFKQSHQKIIQSIESDIHENKEQINSVKIKRMLWNDSDDENNIEDNNDGNTEYVE